MTQEDILAAVQSEAVRIGVPPKLARAIALVESGGNPLAIRYEPAWSYFFQPELFASRNGITVATEKVLQASSFGVMQTMGSVTRELGFNGPLLELAVYPELAIKYGCLKLKSCLDRWGGPSAAIAAYNAGTPRKRDLGPGAGYAYANQPYVDAVMSHL
jgi:soluble lytic murein transglycosylase-like protein